MSNRKRTRTEEDSEMQIKKSNMVEPAPLCTDERAMKERDRVDYTIKITKEMAELGQAPRPVRVYADGIYDMFHSGHARQLMQAKNCFPNVYLIVGICNDELTHEMKGRTAMNEDERYEAVKHCRYVDEILIDAPWAITDEFLEENKIDFVAHDDIPYAAEGDEDIYKSLKDRGMFVSTNRTEGISTTDVIARILKDYDLYVRRNLARGYTAKELNVGYMKEKSLKFKEKVDAMKDMSRDLIGKIDDKRHELIGKWEEMSQNFIGNFIELFGRDGRISHWIYDQRLKVARAISPDELNSSNSSNSSSSAGN